MESPVLALYNPDLPTYVTIDASDYGLGGVFTQLHPDNTETVVAFVSRTLSPAEIKYSTVEREALACVWVERWRTYLWGRQHLPPCSHPRGQAKQVCEWQDGQLGCFAFHIMLSTALGTEM